jgi:hypothetical protein
MDEIYSVLAKGPFTNENVRVIWRELTLSFPADLVDEIEKYWKQIKAPHIFNGDLVRLNQVRTKNNQLVLDLSLSNYATLMYSNEHVETIVNKWGNQYLSNALGISAVVVSSDNKIVLMKRSANVGEFPNFWDVFGGHIDKPENGCAPDVYSAMQKELTEELALSECDYELKALAVIRAHANKKPELIFSAFSNIGFIEIVKQADEAKDKFEWDNISDVPITELDDFLQRERTNLSPSAFASLEVLSELKKEAHFGTRK